ncbi:MAG TPA: cupin domain-containing protein [Streptomyces sp.]
MAEKLTNQLSAGATLVIDGVEELHLPLRSLVAGLEDIVRTFVQANLYVNTSPGGKGFGAHWDDHDAVIIQAAGEKSWSLWPPSTAAPMYGVTKERLNEESTPYWSGSLFQGDLLYLPRGWWHRVIATENPTAHLTLGYRPPTGFDLLSELLKVCRQHNDVFRQDIPRFATASVLGEYLQKLKSEMYAVLESSGSFERIADDLKDARQTRPEFHLPK